jgi:hypothetical protein
LWHTKCATLRASLATHLKQNSQQKTRSRAREYKWRRPVPLIVALDAAKRAAHFTVSGLPLFVPPRSTSERGEPNRSGTTSCWLSPMAEEERAAKEQALTLSRPEQRCERVFAECTPRSPIIGLTPIIGQRRFYRDTFFSKRYISPCMAHRGFKLVAYDRERIEVFEDHI